MGGRRNDKPITGQKEKDIKRKDKFIGIINYSCWGMEGSFNLSTGCRSREFRKVEIYICGKPRLVRKQRWWDIAVVAWHTHTHTHTQSYT